VSFSVYFIESFTVTSHFIQHHLKPTRWPNHGEERISIHLKIGSVVKLFLSIRVSSKGLEAMFIPLMEWRTASIVTNISHERN
jgi:hypothetical protein